MTGYLKPADDQVVALALAAYDADAATPRDLKVLARHYLALLVERAPGASVEVRIPPYAAAQVIAGVRHTRGTPPAVVELSPTTWVALALGDRTWLEAVTAGDVLASGERADLTAHLPLGSRT